MTFRARMTAVTAVAVVLSMLAASMLIFLGVQSTLRSRVDHELRQQGDFLARGAHPHDNGGLRLPFAPRGGARSYVQVVDAHGNLMRPGSDGAPGAGATPDPDNDTDSDPNARCSQAHGAGYEPCSRDTDPLRISATTRSVMDGHPATAFEDQHVEGVHLRVYDIYLADGNTAQLALSLDDVDQSLSRVRTILLAVIAGSALLALVLALLVTRVAAEPMRELEQAVADVGSDQDLHVRIQTTGNDEIGRVARAFNAMLDRLQESRRQQQQLVEDASHELRTPLTSIMTNMEVLELAPDLPEQHRELVRDVTIQVAELGALAGSLVELAHGHRPAAEHEDLALADLVVECVARASRVAQDRATIITEVGSEARVHGDATRLQGAVDNLLSNAIKFSPEGGTITVRVDGGTVEVSDEGPGIAPEDRPHVFDRFYRSVAAKGTPGAGLGLAIVKAVADDHCGSVEALDGPGGTGTTMRLSIPVLGG